MIKKYKMKYKRKINPAAVAAVILTVLAAVWFAVSVGELSRGQSEEARLLLEDAIRRGAVACYAAEGVYPPSVDYLAQHYGVQIDRERFIVFYDIQGENLMPEISVFRKK